ncbi:MAG TPA: TonB-dependent receptor [Holophaga sp.]|nr:TonB-dependent receptor [Holophaga sp.]
MKSTALLFALAGSALLAQTAPKSPSLEDELLALLNTPVQGASKREQRMADSPQAIEVLTGAEIRQQGITRLQDALRLMTSVDLIEAGTEAVSVGLRGVMQDGQPRTLQILVDGAPMYNVLGAGADLDQIPVPIDLVDRIEVVRGPSSTLYGANAVVGVIAITTRRPEEGPHGALRASRGNLGTWRGGAALQFGSGGLAVTGGYEGMSTRNSGQTLPALGDPSSLVTFNAANPDAVHQSKAFARAEGRFRDTTLWAAAGTSSKLMGVSTFPWRRAQSDMAQAGWRQAWTGDFSTELRVHRVEHAMTFAPRPDLAVVLADPMFNGEYKWYDTRTTLVEVQGNWNLRSDLHLVFGADQRKGEAFGPARFIGIKADVVTDKASGGFLSVDWDLTPALSLSVGARAENETLGGSRTSPRVALVWKAGGSRVFRAAFLTSTRSPQISEAQVDFTNPTGLTYPVPGVGDLPLLYTVQPNPGIRPEKTVNFELGYRDSFGPVSLDLTLFRMNLRSLIYQAALPPSVDLVHGVVFLPNQYRNGGDATDTGVEATLNWLVASGWNLGLNATWLDYTRDAADPLNPLDGGKGFSYAPKLKANAYARFRQGRWSGSLAVQYVGATDVEALRTAGAPAYDRREAFLQSHVNVGWEFRPGLVVSAFARNANRPFQPQGTTGVDRPDTYYTARREAGLAVRFSF